MTGPKAKPNRSCRHVYDGPIYLEPGRRCSDCGQYHGVFRCMSCGRVKFTCPATQRTFHFSDDETRWPQSDMKEFWSK